jgi:hypothetical protein
MNNNYVHLTFILDRSGSMATCKSDTDGGFNSYIEDQKKNNVGKFTVSLYQFDDIWETVYENLSIEKVPVLDLKPRNMTALLDAVCLSVDRTGALLNTLSESERPSKVIVIILTDGQENSSKQFNASKVQERIRHQTDKYKWEFVFLGANIDTWSVGSSLGLNANQVCSFSSVGANKGTSNRSMYSTLSAKTSSLRCAVSDANLDSAVMSYTAEEQEEQERLKRLS